MPVIFVLFAVLISIGAVLVIATVIVGMIHHGQIFSRISDHVESQLAQVETERPVEKLVPCSYCRSLIPAGARCSSCGASE